MSTPHNNGLTPAQAERLAILAEECAEVVQKVGKILRHGLDAYNPYDPQRVPNIQLLEEEMGEVQYILELMASQGDLNGENMVLGMYKKAHNIDQFTHHQPISALDGIRKRFTPVDKEEEQD